MRRRRRRSRKNRGWTGRRRCVCRRRCGLCFWVRCGWRWRIIVFSHSSRQDADCRLNIDNGDGSRNGTRRRFRGNYYRVSDWGRRLDYCFRSRRWGHDNCLDSCARAVRRLGRSPTIPAIPIPINRDHRISGASCQRLSRWCSFQGNKRQ